MTMTRGSGGVPAVRWAEAWNRRDVEAVLGGFHEEVAVTGPKGLAERGVVHRPWEGCAGASGIERCVPCIVASKGMPRAPVAACSARLGCWGSALALSIFPARTARWRGSGRRMRVGNQNLQAANWTVWLQHTGGRHRGQYDRLAFHAVAGSHFSVKTLSGR